MWKRILYIICLWLIAIPLSAQVNSIDLAHQVGTKNYELSDHRNNVYEVVSDAKLDKGTSTFDFAIADIKAYQDYYPYGMLMAERNGSKDDLRFGFQGQESDDEVKGNGNSINYTFRMHDVRLGRFFAIDPLAVKYPYNSQYAFSENRVVDRIELEGLETAPTRNFSFSQSQLTNVVKLPTVLPSGSTTEINGKDVVVIQCTNCNSHWDRETRQRINDPIDLIISQQDFNQLNNILPQGTITFGFIVGNASGQIFTGNNFSTTIIAGSNLLSNSLQNINSTFTDIPNTTINIGISNASTTSNVIINSRIQMIRTTIQNSGFTGTINIQPSTSADNNESISIQASDGI